MLPCRSYLLGFACLGLVQLAHAQPNPIPIPQPPTIPPGHASPAYIGAPATPNPVIGVAAIPQNPFLAANGRSNIHGDTYMSDLYFTGGPLGKSPAVLSTVLGGDAVGIGFDQKGRIITAALGQTVRLFLIHPATLATLATRSLGSRTAEGGGYFYLDSNDHLVIGGPGGFSVLKVTDNPPAPPVFTLLKEYDLSTAIAAGDAVEALLPDFSGRIWFTTVGGTVGTVDPTARTIATLSLTGEQIRNSTATDETGGVFVASDHALYRFDADAQGKPTITWREVYDRGYRVKAGQYSRGSGTTPTLMGTQYVTITDNADPQMHVNVYRRAATVEGNRLLCSVPVFQPGQSATENSLIATEHSIIVENNAGWRADAVHGKILGTPFPGITRIDVDDSGCRTVWTNDSVRIPSAVSKLSVQNGLIYTYIYEKGPNGGANGTDDYYFTAIDFHTGQTVFQRLIGQGTYFDNYYSAIHLGPDGRTAYVGVLAGLVAIRDTQ
ncbi:MAG: hypothetical protein ABFD86_04065 [Bryobacteraceae bacterium]